MKILLNTISKYHGEDFEDFLRGIHDYFGADYPEDQLIWLIRENQNPQWLTETDTNKIAVLKKNEIPLIGNIRDRKKIVSLISAHNPDVVISSDPVPLRDSIYQVFLPKSMKSYYEKPASLPASQRKKLAKSIGLCNAVIVHSKYEREFLINHFPELEDKIHILYKTLTAANLPLNYAEKISIKEKYTNLQEYFLVAPGPGKEMVTPVLKGFSGFKKWQRSHMKLALSAAGIAERNELEELLANYRFREDVIIAETTSDDYDKIIASSYAVILPDKYDDDYRFALRVMSAEVLLLIPEESIYSEIIQEDEAFAFKYRDKDDITRVFLTSFREEQKRSATIQKAVSITGRYNQESYLRQLRQIFKESAG